MFVIFSFVVCICIHLRPFEPIRTLLSPFLPLFCLYTHMCFFGKFPGHACPGIIHCQSANPNMSLFVVFACALVKVHPTAPIQTHIHPHIPVRHLDIHEIETYIILRKSITNNAI